MADGVDRSWDRIGAWLNQHVPSLAACFNPGADEATIRTLEREVELPLPADLVAWWRRTDGFDERRSPERPRHPGSVLPQRILCQSDPWPVEQVLLTWRMHLSIQAEFVEQGGDPDLPQRLHELASQPAGTAYGEPVWVRAWLPISTTGGGGGLLVDLRDGPLRGCVMEFDKYFGPSGPLWSSVAAMLAAVADALETGAPVQGQHAVIIDNTLDWE